MITPPYYFACKMATLPRKSSLHSTFKRSQKANTHIKACGQLLAIDFLAKGNSKDPFAVAVMKGKLSVAQSTFPEKNFCSLLGAFTTKQGHNCVSLDMMFYSNALRFLTCQENFFGKEIFAGTNFRDLAKIVKISASREFPTIRYVILVYSHM